MRREGRARRDALVAMCPPGRIRVDVGADHGHVARALGAIASERQPERIAVRAGAAWVVADGLRAFRAVDVAIVAGMGAHTIARILEGGPRPAHALLHAQDDPPVLRRWLAANGWRIVAERLAPEAGRFAELVHAIPGLEPSSGLLLAHGPRLLIDGDPWLNAHLDESIAWLEARLRETEGHVPDRRREWSARRDFLRAHRERRKAL